jgi:hypothetical protein
MLLVQSFLTTRQYGIRPLVEYKEHITLTGIAGRSDRAVKNSLISLIFLLPAILALVSIRAYLSRNDFGSANISVHKNTILCSLFVFDYVGEKLLLVDGHFLYFLFVCGRYRISLKVANITSSQTFQISWKAIQIVGSNFFQG